ncbi:MAG: DUF2946 family protein [Brachymonas sp.]|jgi:hypothetical protein
MQNAVRIKRTHWAQWLLVLAVFAQAFLPALAQAALAQTQAPWTQLCSSANSPAEQWTPAHSTAPAEQVQIPHCAYCLLGGAAAPPPPAAVVVLLLQPARFFAPAPPAARLLLSRVWLTPPLRAPPRTFA